MLVPAAVTEVFTNATGFYGFSNLPTGDYRTVVDPTTPRSA